MFGFFTGKKIRALELQIEELKLRLGALEEKAITQDDLETAKSEIQNELEEELSRHVEREIGNISIGDEVEAALSNARLYIECR